MELNELNGRQQGALVNCIVIAQEEGPQFKSHSDREDFFLQFPSIIIFSSFPQKSKVQTHTN